MGRTRATRLARRPLIAACAISVALSACGATGSHTSATPFPTGKLAHDQQILAGRVIFAQRCATCHGDAGGGGVGPSFTHDKLLRDFPDPAAQINFVEHGRGIMPAWRGVLTTAQITAVVQYERKVLSPR